MARPTKYNPETMLPILEQAAKEGWFLEELPPLLGINQDTMFDWMNEKSPRYNAEFSESIKMVEAGRNAHLTQEIRRHYTGKQKEGSNTAALIFALKNCVGWRDRQEIEQKVEHTGDVVQIRFGLSQPAPPPSE